MGEEEEECSETGITASEIDDTIIDEPKKVRACCENKVKKETVIYQEYGVKKEESNREGEQQEYGKS